MKLTTSKGHGARCRLLSRVSLEPDESARIHWIPLAALLLFTGCVISGEDMHPVEFDCEGKRLLVIFEEDRVRLSRGAGESFSLERVPSASGAKFSDGERTFWTRGREAMLEMTVGNVIRCEVIDESDESDERSAPRPAPGP